MWVLGTESGSLLDQQVLLITKPSIQPLPTPKESVQENIEKFYGFPVDVEWGIEGNEIFILQCRPITTITNNELPGKIKESGISKVEFNEHV